MDRLTMTTLGQIADALDMHPADLLDALCRSAQKIARRNAQGVAE